MEKTANEYQRFIDIKRGIGHVKKELYNVPLYIEDRQRKGVALPTNLVEGKLFNYCRENKYLRFLVRETQAQPSTSARSLVGQRLAQERAFNKSVKKAEQLLEKAQRATSRNDTETVMHEMPNLDKRTENTIQRRAHQDTPIPNEPYRDIRKRRAYRNRPQPTILNQEEIISTIETIETIGRPYSRAARTNLPSLISPRTPRTPRSSAILRNIQLAASRRIDTEQRRLNSKRKSIDKCSEIIQRKKDALREASNQISESKNENLLGKRIHAINKSAIEELLKFWNETTADILKCNTRALNNGQKELSKNPNEATQLWYLQCKEKQKNIRTKISDQQHRIYAAVEAADLNILDIVIFEALDVIFEDQFICGGSFIKKTIRK